MDSGNGMLLFFDEDPCQDERRGFVKKIKQEFKKLKTRKRVIEDPSEVDTLDSCKKKRKRSNLKRKRVDTTVIPIEEGSQEACDPKNTCAEPTVKVRKIPNRSSQKKERKLDSRLRRIMKSKQKETHERDRVSDEASIASSDSGICTNSLSHLEPAVCETLLSNQRRDLNCPQENHHRTPGSSDVRSNCHLPIPCPKSDGECSTESAGYLKATYLDNDAYVSMDCEFVGVGPKGCRNAFGRCTVVDFNGKTLCDIHALPEERITDYRTRWSGIRPQHMRTAIPQESARRIVKKVLKNKIIVGHSLWNDFGVLRIHHPPEMVRDIGTYTPLHQMAAHEGNPPRSLKKLSAALLGRAIQKRQHCSLEDARATLDLFKLVQHQWEWELSQKTDLPPAKKQRSRTLSETSVDNAYLADDFWPSSM